VRKVAFLKKKRGLATRPKNKQQYRNSMETRKKREISDPVRRSPRSVKGRGKKNSECKRQKRSQMAIEREQKGTASPQRDG